MDTYSTTCGLPTCLLRVSHLRSAIPARNVARPVGRRVARHVPVAGDVLDGVGASALAVEGVHCVLCVGAASCPSACRSERTFVVLDSSARRTVSCATRAAQNCLRAAIMEFTIILIVAACARSAGCASVHCRRLRTMNCHPRCPDCGACCCQRDRCQHQARCVPPPRAARPSRLLQRAPAHPAGRPRVKCSMPY